MSTKTNIAAALAGALSLSLAAGVHAAEKPMKTKPAMEKTAAKAGEGSCGASKAAEGSCGASKAAEGSCGASAKSAEGSCGAAKAGKKGAAKLKAKAKKTTEGKCGEGKCGSK